MLRICNFVQSLIATKALHAAESGVLGTGTKRKRSAGKTKGWWKQPWQIDSLLLDTAALLTALETGHSPDPCPPSIKNCSICELADMLLVTKSVMHMAYHEQTSFLCPF